MVGSSFALSRHSARNSSTLPSKMVPVGMAEKGGEPESVARVSDGMKGVSIEDWTIDLSSCICVTRSRTALYKLEILSEWAEIAST